MNKIVFVPSIIIISVFFLIVGFFVGSSVEKNTAGEEIAKVNNVIKAVSSNLVPYISAFGKIQSISGREIILNYAGDTIVVKVGDNAAILTIEVEDDNSSVQKNMLFEDLKVGDSVSVNLSITSDNIIEANRVLLVPVTDLR